MVKNQLVMTPSGKAYFKLGNYNVKITSVNGINIEDLEKNELGWYMLDERPHTFCNRREYNAKDGYEIEEFYQNLDIPKVLETENYELFNGDDDQFHTVYRAKIRSAVDEKVWPASWDEEFEEEVFPTLFVEVERTGTYGQKLIEEIRPMTALTQNLPEILWSSEPCAMTSDQVFEHIKHQIKTRINKSVSKVSWDFSDVLKIEKTIEVTPYTFDVTPFTKSGKKSRVKKSELRNTKDVEVFTLSRKKREHTSSGPKEFIANGISANNHAELKEKLDDICNRIITFINTPAKQCSCCGGTGVTEEGINPPNVN